MANEAGVFRLYIFFLLVTNLKLAAKRDELVWCLDLDNPRIER